MLASEQIAVPIYNKYVVDCPGKVSLPSEALHDDPGAHMPGISTGSAVNDQQNVGRRTRVTTALTAEQASGIIAAAQHAKRIGLPFNRHMSIRLERVGIADADAVKAIGRFLALLRDWLRKQGLATAYAWVRERGSSIGSHVHILLHLPPQVSLKGGRTRRWLELVADTKYAAGTVCTRRISRSAYDANLAVVVGYLCKGASSEVAAELALPRTKRGGTIMGKRAGWSQNVGASARLHWRLDQQRAKW